MRTILAAAVAALFVADHAAAQGIALFGDARLGLGYNIDNDGGLILDDNGNATDDLRGISRVRFGVTMTGTTDSGISFGAAIRADNAPGGQGGTEGETEGDVFVSGGWGTLTFGDTNGADEQWVGDVPGDFSLTGLGEFDETPFISNGGGYGNSDFIQFANDPFARPTIRYDFAIAGFGISLSSNRNLTDIVVGAGYSADFGGGAWSIGVGYDSFESFQVVDDTTTQEVTVIDQSTGLPFTVVAPILIETTSPSGAQWSVGVTGAYDTFSVGATWTKIDLDAMGDADGGSFQTLLVGASAGFGALSVGAYYQGLLNADGIVRGADSDKAYGLTAQYDLGGGATVNAGIANIEGFSGLGDGDSAVVGDIGIAMNF